MKGGKVASFLPNLQKSAVQNQVQALKRTGGSRTSYHSGEEEITMVRIDHLYSKWWQKYPEHRDKQQ